MAVVSLAGATAGVALMVSAAFLSFGPVAFFVPLSWLCLVVPGLSDADCDLILIHPGRIFTIIDDIELDGTKRFDPSGQVLLTTVAVHRGTSVLEWLEASVDDAIDMYWRPELDGDLSESEMDDINEAMMKSSQDTAVVAALGYLGFETADVMGVGFVEVLEDSAADGRLEPGEVIVAVDDEPVTTVASLVELLEDRSPGTTVMLTVQQSETDLDRDEEIVLSAHPDEPDRGIIGIRGLHEQMRWHSLPFSVEISVDSVGGPSGGLAFSLALVDLLTPGELTGGMSVAVTGTISSDGSVGEIGSVRQKAIAARRSGADMFIVPHAMLDEASMGAGSMPVVGVGTLEEAVEVLGGHGGQTSGITLPVGRTVAFMRLRLW